MKHRASWLIGLFALFFVVLFHAVRMPAVHSAGSQMLGGTITANGTGLEGVTVSARADGTTVTTTVFTDQRGAYSFPPLSPGKYRVWAQAMGYATARGEAVLGGEGSSDRRDLTLQPTSDMSMQASSSEWLAALPSATKEDRRMRELLRANCTQCHSTAVILQQRFDEKGWLAIIDFMINGPANSQGGVAAWYDKRSTIEHHREELAKYLTKVRGPNSPPLKFTPVPRPTGEATKVVFTEWDIPNANRRDGLQWYEGSDWSEGSTTSGSRGIDIHDVMTDNYGNAWLTSIGSVHSIYKLNPKTGAVTGFSFQGAGSRPRVTHGMDRDQKGILWFDMFGSLGRIDPATETFQTFTPVKNMSAGPEISTHVDGKGKVWSSTRFGAVRFDPDTKEWTYMQSVRPLDGMSYGNFGDADGNGWWAQYNSDRLGKGDPKTGKSYEVIMRPPWLKDDEDILTPEDKAFYKSIGALSWGKVNEVPGAQAPRRLGGDKHSEYVWAANFAGNNIARVHIRTLEATYYKPPMMGNPYRVDADKEGNVWLAMHGDDRLLKLNPKTGQWIVHRMPGNGCEVRHMSVDQRTDEVWVACHRTGKVVRMQYRTPSKTAPGLPAVPPAKPAASPGEKITRLDYDMKQVVISSTLPADALHGRRLFVQRCAACHYPSVNEEGNSYGPKLPGARIKALGDAALRAKIADGSARMPGFEYTFDKEQMDHLVEYLNTRQ